MPRILLAGLAAYAVGCVPTGYLLVRWRHDADLRTLGSGSTGARNVGRQLGPGWGLLTAALDVLKGAAGVAIAGRIAGAPSVVPMPAVVAGHIWPVMLGFRGGRGIAPAVGAVAIADPLTAGVALAVAASGWSSSGRSRVGVALGIVAAPIAAIALRRTPTIRASVLGTVVLIAAGHRSELRALAQGMTRP